MNIIRFLPVFILSIALAAVTAALCPIQPFRSDKKSSEKKSVMLRTDEKPRARRVLPVCTDFLPHAQALQEGMPGVTATPMVSSSPASVEAPSIPLVPEDLPLQSKKYDRDMRDALAPVYGTGGRSRAETEKFMEGVSWWARILPAQSFNIVLEKNFRRHGNSGNAVPSDKISYR
ncbi:MAG: hypothetical protein ABIG11_04705 [bacterium]